MSKVFFGFKVLFLSLLIGGCGSNGFQLRNNVELESQFSKVYLQGLAADTDFRTTFTEVLKEAGGNIVNNENQATSTLKFSRFKEDRSIVAFTNQRIAREFLVSLKIEYSIRDKNKKLIEGVITPKRRINIDRAYLYDPNFALGNAEEEERVIQTLYEEASRLILFRLKYSKQP